MGSGGEELGESLPKYRVVMGRTREEIEEKLNTLAEVGYSLREVVVDSNMAYPYRAIMSLKDRGKYEDIESLVKVDLEDVDEYLERGYVITEVYSKHAIMVLRRGEEE